jgi:hypothetical protein
MPTTSSNLTTTSKTCQHKDSPNSPPNRNITSNQWSTT